VVTVDRGQAYTLEAFLAATILLASLAVAFQVSAVDPLARDTATQQLAGQQGGLAGSALSAADENGSIEETLRYWNDTGERFHGSGDDGIYDGAPPTSFGQTLEETLGHRGYVYNVNLYHVNTSGEYEHTRLVYQGTPSDRSVRATRMVTLLDDDERIEAHFARSDETLSEIESGYFANDTATDPSGGVFNVVEVEVIAWRT
jgi:hypothetical protein